MSKKQFAIAAVILVTCASGVVLRRALASTSAHFSTIDVNGLTREYILHVPPSYNGKAVPLVIVLHGATQGAASAQSMSGMSTLADQQNFIAVYPKGTGRLVTWNAGNCCGYAQRENVDDVAFLRALVAQLEKSYSIDPRRIYVTGISNGAMMSYRAACEMSDIIAAAAPVEGAQNLPCKPSSPVSLIVFHGTADHLVPYDGGSTPYQLGPRRNDTSVAQTVAFWVKQNGCAPAAKREETKDVNIDIYSGCKDGTGVALYTILGGHHLWPGMPLSQVDLSATDVMWRFFAAHPKA